MTVRQLLESCDSAELAEWMAFYRLEARATEEAVQRRALEQDAARGAVDARQQFLRGT